MFSERKVLQGLTALTGGLFMLFFPAGCSKKNVPPEPPRRTLKITAAFYPQYVMCLNLTQNVPDVELSLLVPDTTLNFSDYRLTTKDLTAVSSCGIFVINGVGMEQFLDQARKLKPDALIIAAENYPLVHNNPYVWVSPSGARYEVRQIAAGLARLDPVHAAQYEANAGIYEKKLSVLSDEMHAALDPYKGSSVISFHEAFPYLAEEFGLHIVSEVKHKTGAVPDKRELTAALRQIKSAQKNNSSICLYAEQQYPPAAAEMIEAETGLPVNELDFCITGQLTPDAYTDAQEKNLLVLRQSLSDNYDDGDNP